ncbi:MAG: hypothetical protein KH828_01705 [Clostridiales bacterium]|nr:hypothetical protein [Clostridiales bacterium]
MKMRSKTKGYLLLLILGVLILTGDIVCKEFLSEHAEGILSAVGSMVLGIGVAKFFSSRMEEKHPQQMKQNQIEVNDERNVMIRHRAQALSGLVLQWGILTVAWMCILLDGPLWMILTGTGAFLGKTIVEIVLMAYYENKM